MKKFAFAALSAALLATCWAKTSTPEGWTDDLDAALKQAKAEGKQVLVDFSGSDWCGWCQRLDKEVFDTAVFRKGAKDKFVLVMIDSPQDKSLLSDAAKEKNPGLVEKFGIQGFPSVIILDGDGNKLYQTGYQRGGPEAYLEMLDRELKDAPGVAKYIAPIETKLQGPSEALEQAIATAGKAAQERIQAFEKSGLDRGVMMAVYCSALAQELAKTVPEKIPALEQALSDAKAVQVPESMKTRKESLVKKAQATVDALKSVLAK